MAYTDKYKSKGSNYLNFNGINSRVFVPDVSGLTNFGINDSFTIALRANWTTVGADVSISEHWQGGFYPWMIRIGSNALRFACYDGTRNPTTSPQPTTYNDGNWHDIVCVRDRASFKLFLYVDGVLKGSVTDTTITSISSSSNGFTVGARSSAGDKPFPGNIDYFNVYLGAATPAEIAANNIQTPILKAQLLFEEGSGTIVYDSSGNGNNGTITAATWVNKWGNKFASKGSSFSDKYPNTGKALKWQDDTATWTASTYSWDDTLTMGGSSYSDKYPVKGSSWGDKFASSAGALKWDAITDIWSLATYSFDATMTMGSGTTWSNKY